MRFKADELTTYISRGIAPKYTEIIDGAATVVNQKCIRDYQVNLELARLNDLSKRKVPTEKLVQKYDVLVNSTGVGTLGRVGQFLGNEANLTVDTHVTIVRPDKDVIDPLFFGYLMKSKQSLIESFATGTTGQTELSRDSIKEMEVSFVENREHQQAIGNFLLAIDRKLQLNKATNQTLEQMAQAIFKSWFVDFDPVKAKVNGEQPEGMDATTASLFPEKLDSETGIPAGWSQGVIADIAKLNGKSWTKKKHPDEVYYVDLANTKNGVIESVTFYDFEDSPSRARRVLNPGDTIVGTVRPGNRSFAYIGETEQPLTGSTGFAVLTPKEEYWSSFVYLATTNDDSIDEYARLADGGAYPAIKPAVVAETECAIPSKEIAEKFWQLTGSMLKKAHQNRLENEDLAALRDTLLPKLLSGEIELETK